MNGVAGPQGQAVSGYSLLQNLNLLNLDPDIN